jgi:hypothetical protein
MPFNCFSCQNEITLLAGETISRQDTCNKCYSDLRVCRNCDFYDKTAYNECRESNADRITEKEKANFCSYFRASDQSNDPQNGKDSFLSQAEALFKK